MPADLEKGPPSVVEAVREARRAYLKATEHKKATEAAAREALREEARALDVLNAARKQLKNETEVDE